MTYFHKNDRQKTNMSLLNCKGSQLENVLKQINKWARRDETKGLFEQLNHKHSFRHFWTIYGLDENWNEKRSAELSVGVIFSLLYTTPYYILTMHASKTQVIGPINIWSVYLAVWRNVGIRFLMFIWLHFCTG